MDRQDLERDPELLEQIVCYDWMSPTAVECQHFGITESLHARISFHKEKGEVWIIDGNELIIKSWPDNAYTEPHRLVSRHDIIDF